LLPDLHAIFPPPFPKDILFPLYQSFEVLSNKNRPFVDTSKKMNWLFPFLPLYLYLSDDYERGAAVPL